MAIPRDKAELLSAITANFDRAWYQKWTMGRMIQLNTSSPYDNARKRLRKWKRQTMSAH